MSLVLSDLYRYPVKSCRGQQLADAAVEPWGLAGDRRWMVVDAGGEVVTARERPRLVLVTPHLRDGGLLLTGPGRPDLTVPVPSGGELIPVTVWDSKLLAAPAGPAADAWFSEVIGERARLVYLDDTTRRPTDPAYSRPGDLVSFADGYPLLLTTESSLADLNQNIAAGPRASEGPLPMMRFRPSVVIAGAAPWDEDGWRLLRIGGVPFRAVKGCARCVLTMIDPDTAISGKEPIATLARIRRWDGGTWFGVNLIPDLPGGDASIRVGDPVEVLERDDIFDGPLR
ncbi:MAG TPA: MOSC N-terminal beta barrel domain-containing protein [Streptosporangiaceae bacterium]|nr:MOSC N-terminal beta barrel domain-containing protein [Streptosporangiaceae bacterium]